MSLPEVVTRNDWLTARKELLLAEKELTRARDALIERRRALPMAPLEKEYVFEGPGGQTRLLDMFEGRQQLIVYHFMWMTGPDEGCPSCSVVVDNMGHPAHLNGCETTLVAISQARFASIERFKNRMGWSLPWYSSDGNDFNYDFHVTTDSSVVSPEYNYEDRATAEAKGREFWPAEGQDGHGVSVFVRDGDRVFHTYSAYGRGPEVLVGTYSYLDLTPLGRQRHISQFPHHDRY